MFVDRSGTAYISNTPLKFPSQDDKEVITLTSEEKQYVDFLQTGPLQESKIIEGQQIFLVTSKKAQLEFKKYLGIRDSVLPINYNLSKIVSSLFLKTEKVVDSFAKMFNDAYATQADLLQRESAKKLEHRRVSVENIPGKAFTFSQINLLLATRHF